MQLFDFVAGNAHRGIEHNHQASVIFEIGSLSWLGITVKCRDYSMNFSCSDIHHSIDLAYVA